MGLSENITSLATRVATEIKAVRAEAVSALAGKVSTSLLGATSGVATLDSNGFLTLTHRSPVAGSVQRFTSASGAITPNESNIIKEVICTGNVTVNVPSSWWEREVLRFEFFASGGTRTVTFHADYKVSTGVTRGPYSIASGQSLFVAAEYSYQQSKWILTAATTSKS